MQEVDRASGYTDDDTPLGRLASELRARGAELPEPNQAPGSRQVPILKPTLGGQQVQVWESAFAAGFLAGHGELVGPVSAPGKAADRIIELLHGRGRRC